MLDVPHGAGCHLNEGSHSYIIYFFRIIWSQHELQLTGFGTYVSGLSKLLTLSDNVSQKEPTRLLLPYGVPTSLATSRGLDGLLALAAERAILSLSYCLAIGYAQMEIVYENNGEEAAAAGAIVAVLRTHRPVHW